jgi:hypothetical protein
MRAVYFLGERKTRAALEPLKAAFHSSTDPYFKAEVLQALAKIDVQDFETFAQGIDFDVESPIVRAKWQQLISRL